MEKKPFRITPRAVAALVLGLCLIVLPLTALGMEASEGHRGAAHAWREVHGFFGLLFTISGLSHAILNRRQITSHIKGFLGI
jgi:hypothetical protein